MSLNTPVTSNAGAADYFMALVPGNEIVLAGTTTSRIDSLAPTVTADTSTYTVLGWSATSVGGRPLSPLAVACRICGTGLHYMYAGEDSLIMFDSTKREATAITMLRTPIRVGQAWPTIEHSTTFDSISSVNETVVTSAGTFYGVVRITQHYSDAVTTSDFEYFLARGVGIVRLYRKATTLFGPTFQTTVTEQTLVRRNF